MNVITQLRYSLIDGPGAFELCDYTDAAIEAHH